jgi:hypothetical protein
MLTYSLLTKLQPENSADLAENPAPNALPTQEEVETASGKEVELAPPTAPHLTELQTESFISY